MRRMCEAAINLVCPIGAGIVALGILNAIEVVSPLVAFMTAAAGLVVCLCLLVERR